MYEHKARTPSATQRILMPLATSSQQKVDRDLEVGETVENKADEIFNKNPTSYFIKEVYKTCIRNLYKKGS